MFSLRYFLVYSFLVMIATPFTDFGLFSLDEEDTSGLEPTFWDDTSELDPNALLFDDIDLSISNDEPSLQLAIAADDLSVCSSLSSPPPVKRARRADVCDYPDVAPGEETQTRPETTTQEQLQKYWCPTNFAFSFGNLPACDRRPAKKSPSELGLFPPTPPSDEPGSELNDRPPFSDPTGFTNLQWCSLLTPWTLDDCPKGNVWCCNSWLSFQPMADPLNTGVGEYGACFWCWPSPL